MIYKILGSGLIFAGSLIIYFEKRVNDTKSLKQANAYLKLLLHIKNKVETYSMPVEKIIACCDTDIIEACGLSDFKSSFVSLYKCIENATLILDASTKKIILNFAEEFGTSYSVNQIKICEYYIQALKSRISELKDSQGKNAKVYLALSLCITLSLVLILL